MAKISIWNIGKANAEISSAQDTLTPALEKAGIKTLTIDGKSVAAVDAPLALQISALIAAQPPVTDSQNAAEALVSNELISKELETAKTELAIKTTAVESLTRDKAAMDSSLSTATATVQSQSVQIGVLTTERNAAVNQFTSNSKELTAQKTVLARRCIAARCVDLIDENGKALPADAGEETKLAAVMRMPQPDLFKAYCGAVNAAIAKTGANPLEIPVLPPGGKGNEKPALKGRDRMVAATKIQGKAK
jgi:hypothetical protein